MLRWAFKSLVHERLRSLAVAGGAAAALLLVFLIQGVSRGTTNQLVAYIERAGADAWVMQSGVSNMHMATSVLPADLEPQLREAGAARVERILYLSNLVKTGEQQWFFSYIVGIDPAAEASGPWVMEAGKRVPGRGEAVIPGPLAAKAGLDIGEPVTVLDRPFTVAGLSSGTYSMANSVTFLAFADLSELLGQPDTASYYLVNTPPQVPPSVFAQRVIGADPTLNVLSTAQLARNDRVMADQMGVDLIRVMSLIGLVVSSLVVAFALYASTVRRAREYGVIRALGAQVPHLLVAIAAQAGLLALLSFLIAVGLAYGARPIVAAVAPEVRIVYTAGTLGLAALLTLLIAVLASLLPLARVARVDPAGVFKE